MRIEITIGPITILQMVIFEPTEDLVGPDFDCPPDGEDLDKKLRGDD